MFGWTKGKKTESEDNLINIPAVHTADEMTLIADVESAYQESRAVRQSEADETGLSIEEIWEDEHALYKGGGLQWTTNMAYRSKKARQIRPNSEDNFIFNALTTQQANILANMPEVVMSGMEESDAEIAHELTCMSQFNDERNVFHSTWRKLVHDFTGAGPTILSVTWDSEWMGGAGPNRWVGDVRVERRDKREMFFDSAIADLEQDMQSCSAIIHRPRKKLAWIRSMWPDRGQHIGTTTSDNSMILNEGSDPEQTYVYEYWHRGFPKFMPAKRAKELRAEAESYAEKGDSYREQDYYDAAKGELEGIHCAYVAGGVLLEYVPYMFEHGLYPFVYTSKYFDEDNQFGFGEIRNIKIPQIMHNKADEIELESMIKEGLGGYFYQDGAISDRQLQNIVKDSAKGGMLFPVDNLMLMKPREGARVPGNIPNYKEHKQRMVETVGSNTAIQQGMSPGSNVPLGTVKELGARTDIKTKAGVEKLADFLKQANKLRIFLFAQFYTEDRYYRIKGTDGKSKEGTFNASKLMQSWARDVKHEPMMDDGGQPMVDQLTGQPMQEPIDVMEYYVPEFDVSVKILSEKPTDPSYYEELAFTLYDKQLLTAEDLYYTIDEGKLPTTKDILQHLGAQNAVQGLIAQIGKLPPEAQQQITQMAQQMAQQMTQQIQGQEQQGQEQQKLQGMVQQRKDSQNVNALLKGGYV